MASDEPPRLTRRRQDLVSAAGEHPSGRWDFEDPEVTPPPVDPESAAAWKRLRGRVTELQVMLAGLVPSVDGLVRRVDQLEQKDAEMARSLASVEKTQAVQTALLTNIESGIRDLKAARDGDGARFRHVLQIVVAVAALASSIIAIVLANR